MTATPNQDRLVSLYLSAAEEGNLNDMFYYSQDLDAEHMATCQASRDMDDWENEQLDAYYASLR